MKKCINFKSALTFITVLAYQCVQVLRVQLKAKGLNACWSTLRDTLSVQRRVTASFRQCDGRTLHVRKSTVAETDLMDIYRLLGLNPAPGGTKKLISRILFMSMLCHSGFS